MLDNYDSFTYNLYDYFSRLGVEVVVVRNDSDNKLVFCNEYKGVILSPGPGEPRKANKLMKAIAYYHQKVPILGICLGHQALGEFFGANLKKNRPMHGKISKIKCNTTDILYQNLPQEMNVVRYHSLVLSKIPDKLNITSYTPENEPMSFTHKILPISGIQYHPEAHLTENGMKILENWLKFNKLIK